MSTLAQLHWQQPFASLPDSLHSAVPYAPLTNPQIAVSSPSCAKWLGLTSEPQEWLDTVLADTLPHGQASLAQKYTGHQFGQYNPMLGDGRGLLLGQINTPNGNVELHLKGAGQTPYSRGADGRAVLRSSLREFWASEALAALGEPTTRALCVMHAEDHIAREELETAALLVRATPSHIRFGHFEYLFHSQQPEVRDALLEYVFAQHFPDLQGLPWLEAVETFFQRVVTLTARMIAGWQQVGFLHGVMNTDNMSILGETFDFGPYRFMDNYVPDLVFNRTDMNGRYAFNQQPSIGLWNLNCLALAFSDILSHDQLVNALKQYEPHYYREYHAAMGRRFGFSTVGQQETQLIHQLLSLMASHQADYHNTFRQLMDFNRKDFSASAQTTLDQDGHWHSWAKQYAQCLNQQDTDENEQQALMAASNPVYVLRHHLGQQAIAAAKTGDFAPAQLLYDVLSEPFKQRDGLEEFAEPAPRWAQKAMLSCSS